MVTVPGPEQLGTEEPRIAAWDRRVDWPLTALAVVFLVAYAWSVLDTTISPLGYPVTFEGGVVAAALMVAGIALLGVVTASIASWFVENLRRTARDVEAEIGEESARTAAQLDAVLTELRAISARPDVPQRARD